MPWKNKEIRHGYIAAGADGRAIASKLEPTHARAEQPEEVLHCKNFKMINFFNH